MNLARLNNPRVGLTGSFNGAGTSCSHTRECITLSGSTLDLQDRTSKQWREIFETLGWRLVHQQYLGVDEPIVPERHALYVLEPRTNIGR